MTLREKVAKVISEVIHEEPNWSEEVYNHYSDRILDLVDEEVVAAVDWQKRRDAWLAKMENATSLLHATQDAYLEDVPRLRAEVQRLREALDRIIGLCGDNDRCACGRPNGLPAIILCSRAALRGGKQASSKAERETPQEDP